MTAARKLPDHLPMPTAGRSARREDSLVVIKRTVRRIFEDAGERIDANETLTVARSLLAVEAAPIWKNYLPPVWRSLFPIDGTVPEWADAHAYEEIDEIGDADVVDDYADDAPEVDVKSTEQMGRVIPIRSSFGYSVHDLRKAGQLLMPLDTAKAIAARDVYERRLEKLVAFGWNPTATNGIKGITNAANITHATDAAGVWSAASVATIQAEVENLIKTIETTTNGIHETNLVLFPQTEWSIIRTKRLDNFNQATILDYFRKVFPEITFAKWNRLNLAGNNGTGGRVMAFERGPQNAKVVIPMEFRTHPVQQRGLMYKVECEGRYGGWKIPKPKSIAYMDLTS